jgi:hypothetical protein
LDDGRRRRAGHQKTVSATTEKLFGQISVLFCRSFYFADDHMEKNIRGRSKATRSLAMKAPGTTEIRTEG